MDKPMNIKLKPLTVEDYLGRKHVRGVYASQEVFQVDMLNRALVELCKERRAEKVVTFMKDLWVDTQKPPFPHKDHIAITFDEPTERAYEACVQAYHPVVALSLLRLARIEQLHVGFIEMFASKFGPETLEHARGIVGEYVADNLKIGMYVNGTPVEDTMRGIFQLTGKDILKERPEIDWYFGEFLNTPYAVQADLIFPAQLILAKCYAVRDLERLMSRKLMKDGEPSIIMEIITKLESLRYEYLFRQTQWAFIELSGFTN